MHPKFKIIKFILMINCIDFKDIYTGSQLSDTILRVISAISTDDSIQWDATQNPGVFCNKAFKLKLQLQDILLRQDSIEREILVPPDLLYYKQYYNTIRPSSHEGLVALLYQDFRRYCLLKLQAKQLLSLDTMDSFIIISITILKQTCEVIIKFLRSQEYANLNLEQQELILTQLRYMIAILYNMQGLADDYIEWIMVDQTLVFFGQFAISQIYNLAFFSTLISGLSFSYANIECLDVKDIIDVLFNIADIKQEDIILQTFSSPVTRAIIASRIDNTSFIDDKLTFSSSSLKLVNNFFNDLNFQTISIIAIHILLTKPIYELIIEYGQKIIEPHNDDEKKNIMRKCILDLIYLIYNTNKDKILEMLCIVDQDNKNTDKLIANVGSLLFDFILRGIKDGELSAEDAAGLKTKINYTLQQIPYIMQKLNQLLISDIDPSSENPAPDPTHIEATQTFNESIPFRRSKISTSGNILKTIYENKVLWIITIIFTVLIILTSIAIIIYCLFKILIFCFIGGCKFYQLLISFIFC